nr:uncharacterized protein LOC126545698 isoform X1 [Dermacentor andersoni]XP_054917900.1 uncharacterized protein LOC126545698 isoform X1 [Dermacentor andersoni]
MSYHSSRWWAYCLIFAFACQVFLALPGTPLEFQGLHLAHAPVGERSEKHENNGTCTFRGDPYAVDKFIEKAAVECYMYTNGLREEYQKKVCYKVGFPKICLNCTTDARPPNEEDCHLPDINDENSPLFLAFRTKAIGRLWANCVREAIACCHYMLDTPRRTDGIFCNRTWDGLTCYEDTDVNRNVSKVCPRVLYIYSKPHCEYYSTRWCHENGSWYRLMNVQRTFYTSCAPKPWVSGEYVGVYHYSIGLFTLSVLSLIPALFIFNWYKSLQVPRIMIHKHLCLAVMMCGVMYIIDHSVFTLDDVKPTKYTKNLTHSNTWWCKLLSVLNRYFMVSQYTWMLCEGYYLHRLVAQAFSKQMNLKFCYTFGWGLPALLVIIYSILRATQSDDRCWRNIVVYDYAFTGPILTCLAEDSARRGDTDPCFRCPLRVDYVCEPSIMQRLHQEALRRMEHRWLAGILRLPHILLPQRRNTEPGETLVQPLQERPQHKQEASAERAADHHYHDDGHNSHVKRLMQRAQRAPLRLLVRSILTNKQRTLPRHKVWYRRMDFLRYTSRFCVHQRPVPGFQPQVLPPGTVPSFVCVRALHVLCKQFRLTLWCSIPHRCHKRCTMAVVFRFQPMGRRAGRNYCAETVRLLKVQT